MTLTEQWKKGELPFGAYYVNRLEEHRIWLYNDRSKTPESQYEIYEILAPVPSYEEYSRLEWYAGCGPDRIVELNKENRKLKELLKECRDDVYNYQYICLGTLTKMDNAIGEKK